VTAESQTVTVPDQASAGHTASDFVRDPLAARILLLATALGVVSDPLFLGEPPGVQFPVFVGLALLALWTTARHQARHSTAGGEFSLAGHRPAAVASVLALACAGFVFVRAQPFLTLLNAGMTLGLLGLAAALLHGKRLLQNSIVGLVVAEVWIFIYAAVLPLQLTPRAVSLSSSRKGARSLLPIGRGIALAVPVLFVFAGLMASADAVFARYVNDIFDFAFLDTLVEWMSRVLFMLGVAWCAAGWMAAALQRINIPFAEDDAGDAAVIPGLRRWVRIGMPEAATLLVLVELLFAAFVLIQVKYLFAGERAIGVDGYTYAEYARRGFFELVAMAALSLGLLLGLNDLTRRVGPIQRLVFRVLAGTLVGLVLVILVSAFQRLSLYESAYGYTHLRLVVHTFIVWLAVALGWCAWSLWTQPRRFAAGALACAIGFVLSLDVMNPDALIVRRNLERYEATGDVDLLYLEGLSSDATPALVAALPVLRDVEILPSPPYYPKSVPLQPDLAARAERLAEHRGAKAGPGFNLSEWRARRALESAPITADLPHGSSVPEP
jgi:hypothetical protein